MGSHASIMSKDSKRLFDLPTNRLVLVSETTRSAY
jgi:hypothetical protein